MKKFAMAVFLWGFMMIQTPDGLFRVSFDDMRFNEFGDGLVIDLVNPVVKPANGDIGIPIDLPQKDRLGNSPVREVTIQIKTRD